MNKIEFVPEKNATLAVWCFFHAQDHCETNRPLLRDGWFERLSPSSQTGYRDRRSGTPLFFKLPLQFGEVVEIDVVVTVEVEDIAVIFGVRGSG